MIEVALAMIEKSDQESMGGLGFHLKLPAIQSKEDVGCKESDPFIPIDERMIHEKGLKKRRGHFREVLIIAGSRAVKGAFEKTKVADSCGPSEPFDEGTMHGEHLIDRQVLHSLIRDALAPQDELDVVPRIPGWPR